MNAAKAILADKVTEIVHGNDFEKHMIPVVSVDSSKTIAQILLDAGL